MNQIDRLLESARKMNASDVHLTVGAPMALRINGALKKMKTAPDEQMHRAILSMLTPEQERRLNEGEDIDFSFTSESGGRQRVNVYRQHGGKLAAAIRLLNDHVPDYREIMLPNATLGLAKEMKGLVLVTGPTGSGKSTTLAAMVDYINANRECHILTIEDPVEYMYESKLATIHQREIGVDVRDFNSALRSALRENPDVILVGEMRDYETIRLAITAAETGHLVFGTLHTVSASQTINRIIDVFPADEQNQVRSQLSSNLRGVISQMLLPCKNEERGRTAAFEILINNDACANNIRTEKIHQIEQVMSSNVASGMRTMNESLKRLSRDGIISKEVALTYSPDKEEFKKMMV